MKRGGEQADKAIQDTNNVATISRLSAVQLGYFEDPFVHHFVKRPQRRSPIINRGSYLRSAALDSLVQQFLEIPGGPKQIVSLGAGFDTRYFMIKSGKLGQTAADQLAHYFEVDFDELTIQKAMVIKRRPELLGLLGENVRLQKGGSELIGPDYCLVGGDLRQWSGIAKRLIAHGLDTSVPTLFLSECVFIYLTPENSQTILRWIKDTISHCMFALYEQIKPDDPFGKMMIQNLQHRGIELKGIHAFPDLEQQQRRFTDHGWQYAKAVDLNTIHDRWLDRNDLARMAKLEMLDELEEWRFLSSHYCIAWAYKSQDTQYVFHTIALQNVS